MLNDLATFTSAILASRMDAEWSYDQSTGRYRDAKGRFLSKASIEKLVDKRIDKLNGLLRRFTRMLIDEQITLDQWQDSVRQALKTAHIQTAIIGYGGRTGMGSAEYGRIGQRLREEYSYLQGFVRDLMGGRVSAPMALARIGLYAQSVRGSYWEGAELRQQQKGYSLMRRILDDQAQHCQDCLRYAGQGIVAIGTLPLPGRRCECGARCRCTVRYYRQQPVTVPV